MISWKKSSFGSPWRWPKVRMVGFVMQSQEGGGPKLKYLDFVHVAAIQAVVSLASVYDFAKENSGPLNPGVQTVVGTVKTVIGSRLR